MFETIKTREAENKIGKRIGFGSNMNNPSPIKKGSVRGIFENSERDRNEIRTVHDERINDSFIEEINSIVLQEGTPRTTAKN